MKKSIIIILVLCILCCILVGCNSNKIDYNIVKFEQDNSDDSWSTWNIKALVASKDELDIICSQVYETSNENDDIVEYRLNKFFENYDEDFFKDGVLLICLFTMSHAGARLYINSVESADNTVTVNITKKERVFAVYAQVFTNWICIIELDKNDVSSNAQLDINFKTKKVLF